MSCADYLSTMFGAARQLSVHLQFGGCWLACLFGAPLTVTKDGVRYDVITVMGDGNCLFRAVAQGEARLPSMVSQPLPKADEDYRSKELRAMAVHKLAENRKELAWSIEATEGPFDDYLLRMSQLGEWGGQTELIMLSRALQRPIEVYMMTPDLQKIETCGEEYNNSQTIRLLFHDYGHYSLMVEAQDEILVGDDLKHGQSC